MRARRDAKVARARQVGAKQQYLMRGRGNLVGSYRDGHEMGKRKPNTKTTNNITTTLYNWECNVQFPHELYTINFTT